MEYGGKQVLEKIRTTILKNNSKLKTVINSPNQSPIKSQIINFPEVLLL